MQPPASYIKQDRQVLLSDSMSVNNPNRPSMFTCARQVSVIQVGTDALDIKEQRKYASQAYSHSAGAKARLGDEDHVPNSVLKRVSSGLSFTDEVYLSS